MNNFHSRSYSDRQPQLEPTTNGIIKIHSDSQKSLDRLFNPQPGPVPLRQRNLPSSFFNPTAKPATVIRQPLHYRNFSSPAFMPNNNNNNSNTHNQLKQQQQHQHQQSPQAQPHQHQIHQQQHHLHQHQHHQHQHQHHQHQNLHHHQTHQHQHQHQHHQHQHQQQHYQNQPIQVYGEGFSSSHEHIASPNYTNGSSYQATSQIMMPQTEAFVQDQHSVNFNENQTAAGNLTDSTTVVHQQDNQAQCSASRFVGQACEPARAVVQQVQQPTPQEMQDVSVQSYGAKNLHMRSNFVQTNQADIHRTFQQGQFSNLQNGNCNGGNGVPANQQFASGSTNSHARYEYHQNNCQASSNGQSSLSTIHQGDQAYFSPSTTFTSGLQSQSASFGTYSATANHHYQHRPHQFNQMQFNQNQDQPSTIGYQAS